MVRGQMVKTRGESRLVIDELAQASGCGLLDGEGRPLAAGKYLLSRAGEKPVLIEISEDPLTCDLVFVRHSVHGAAVDRPQRVEELAGDVRLDCFEEAL